MHHSRRWGHVNERKASFNLGKEERLEIDMTDFDTCVTRVGTSEEKPVMSGILLAVCPEGAAKSKFSVPSLNKARSPKPNMTLGLCLLTWGSFLLPKGLEMLIHTHKLN